VRVLWSLKPRRVMKVMFDLSSGKCFWVVSIPHHCFVHSTTGRSGSPFTLGAGLLVSTRRGVNEPSRSTPVRTRKVVNKAAQDVKDKAREMTK